MKDMEPVEKKVAAAETRGAELPAATADDADLEGESSASRAIRRVEEALREITQSLEELNISEEELDLLLRLTCDYQRECGLQGWSFEAAALHVTYACLRTMRGRPLLEVFRQSFGERAKTLGRTTGRVGRIKSFVRSKMGPARVNPPVMERTKAAAEQLGLEGEVHERVCKNTWELYQTIATTASAWKKAFSGAFYASIKREGLPFRQAAIASAAGVSEVTLRAGYKMVKAAGLEEKDGVQ